MKIYFIRHGETKGNREHRYVGSTDESLLQESITVLKNKKMPMVSKVYVSPMKRCIETANILYPESRHIIAEDLRECNFGDFEYCNYNELKDNKYYQLFIDSMGECSFPKGESKSDFQKRCVREFEKILLSESQDIALVVHGGTIMAILDKYSCPHKDYYNWQCKNGEGFVANVKGSYLTDIKEI